MEIWKNSEFVESTAREIAAQTQSRTHVLEVLYKSQVTLWPVDHGELLITVLKGVGTLKKRERRKTVSKQEIKSF